MDGFSAFLNRDRDYHIVDEALASGWRLQAKQSGQSAVLLHNNPVHIQQAGDISTLRGYRDGQSGQKHTSRHPAERVAFKTVRVFQR